MILDSVEILNKAKKVKILLMDVDGVLTDGRIIFDSDGRELKFFHVRDGHGIKILHKYGIETGIITGRNSKVVDIRAKELGIKMVYQKAWKKKDVIEKIMSEGGFAPEEVAYIGDDIVDIPVFRRVGFRVAVPDASYDVRNEVDYITLSYAGKGAVREVCDLILRAKGLWKEIVDEYCK
jgi:3-deoxy-D-manno-octulosonate 8-phosphate phosphatase (KDO 8-P phosphatase)